MDEKKYPEFIDDHNKCNQVVDLYVCANCEEEARLKTENIMAVYRNAKSEYQKHCMSDHSFREATISKATMELALDRIVECYGPVKIRTEDRGAWSNFQAEIERSPSRTIETLLNLTNLDRNKEYCFSHGICRDHYMEQARELGLTLEEIEESLNEIEMSLK